MKKFAWFHSKLLLGNSLNFSELFFFCLKGFWGQPQGPDFLSPRATMLALRLDCSTAALTTHQKVLSI